MLKTTITAFHLFIIPALIGNSNGVPQPQQGNIYDDLPPPDCTCVPYYLCANGTVITDGVGIIDIRERVEGCKDALEVCCKAPLEERPTRTPDPIPRKSGCGFRNDQGVGMRIKGDENNEAQFGEFPWMIGVLEQQDKQFIYKCGGSLIHPQVVLTAAHCVVSKKPGSIFVRAGEWDTQTTNELIPYQQKGIREILIHDGYYSAGLHNDVALLFMVEPFELAENVDIVCLPQSENDISLSPDCLASGWGKDKFERDGIYQVILKKVELPMVSKDECQKRLRETRLGNHFKLHESFVCAGGIPERDTCKGDGGSPLVCPVPNQFGKYYQTGIVAWGIGCGTTTPGVYVNVAHFRRWIDFNLQRY